MQKHDAEQHDKGRHKVDEHGSRAHTHKLDGVGVEQAEHKQPQCTCRDEPDKVPQVDLQRGGVFRRQPDACQNGHRGHTHEGHLGAVDAVGRQDIDKDAVCAPAGRCQQHHQYCCCFLLFHSPYSIVIGYFAFVKKLP